MKKFTILFAITLIALMVFAERPIWSQYDWTGGDSQLQMSDSTMYFEKENTVPNTEITLDWFSDTIWTKLLTYPTQIAEYVNDFELVNDTLFACTALKGIVAYSTTYGDNWTEFDTLPIPQSSVTILNMISYDECTYVVGRYGGVSKGFIFRSFDRQTWDSTTIQPTIWGRVDDIVHMRGDTFIIVSSEPQNFLDGYVWMSIDACSTWTNTDTLSDALISSIEKLNDSTVIIGKDSGLGNGVLAMTIDCGATWTFFNNTLLLDMVYGLYVDEINSTIYVGDSLGQLAKTGIIDTIWTLLDTSNVIGDTMRITEITYIDTVMYISTANPGNLYKSYDNGYTVILAKEFTDREVGKLDKIGPHTYGITTADYIDGGRIYYSSYISEGYLTSSVFDMDSTTPLYVFAWGNAPRKTGLTFKLRTGNLLNMSDADDWSLCPDLAVAGDSIDLSVVSSVDDSQRYMQYMINLVTSAKELTPQFDSIMVAGDYLGIEDLQIFDGNVSYNRISGSMMSMDYNGSSNMKITIYDMSGRMVYNGILKPGKNILNTKCVQGKYIVKFNNSKDNIIILK